MTLDPKYEDPVIRGLLLAKLKSTRDIVIKSLERGYFYSDGRNYSAYELYEKVQEVGEKPSIIVFGSKKFFTLRVDMPAKQALPDQVIQAVIAKYRPFRKKDYFALPVKTKIELDFKTKQEAIAFIKVVFP